MIHTSVEQILGTECDVHGDGWESRRLILARDGLVCSIHETTVRAGMFTPRANVSVVKRSFRSPDVNIRSTTSLWIGRSPAWW